MLLFREEVFDETSFAIRVDSLAPVRLDTEHGKDHRKGAADRNSGPHRHLWVGLLVDEPHLLATQIHCWEGEFQLSWAGLEIVLECDILRKTEVLQYRLNLLLELLTGEEPGDDHTLPRILPLFRR